ncbi:TRAP-type C4-dicarboxylate transport system, large permease component [hydrothermal vent metagenome]|uniref:TRAP-type C4-dicarboxylate transport system, large permease component n=1 Tax=hydrothermal vent metagenome TaxID=652676 RepID=A0A3B0QZ08_9ZZZZ
MDQQSTATLILLGLFLFLMFLRVPIAFALGLSSLATAIYLGIPTMVVAHRMVNGLNSFTFLAIPFFILAGQLMGEGGISDRLVRFADTLVGRMRGGLAQANIVSSTMFGGISGSSVADIASIGSFLIPSMVRRGYRPGYAVSVTITSSVQGVLIPPSQNMIYYALAAGGIPLEKLFLAGYIPGILLGGALMLLCWFLAVRQGHPKGESYGFRESIKVGLEASIGLFTVVIIIGGILLGIFTATESAAVATVYAVIVTRYIYRTMPLKKIVTVLKQSLETLATVIAIIMTSSAFAFLLSYLEIPEALANMIFSLSSNPVVAMLAINLLLLVLGMLMDMGVLILLLTPILLPIALKIGVDPVHFGIIMMVNLGIGLCTPPVGTSLLVGCSIGKVSVERTVRELAPFYLIMLVLLMVITFLPDLSLFLPGMIE